jgi:hypothetical protein
VVRKFRPKEPILETYVASMAISWLESNGWDVYQEVDEIDIVAIRGSVLWAMECKTSMGFDVLDQALRRRSLANGVWVATPPRNKSRVAKLACSSAGIGWLVITKSHVNVECYPIFQRKTTGHLRERLRPEHKTFSKAGSPTGKRWTPFKETCRDLVSIVRASPGIRLSLALKKFKHHYKSDSSAMRSLSVMIMNGVLSGIKYEFGSDRSILLFPVNV